MAETQNKKKVSAKGKKSKKGSPIRRSFFLKPATIILALLTSLLLILGILYLARVQHWFSSPNINSLKKHGSIEKPAIVEESATLATIKPPVQHEEYHDIPVKKRLHRQLNTREKEPLVAIIVDDLGADLAVTRDFLNININLTAAILPNVPHSRESAELVHASGREILLHLPMEPQEYPAKNPGGNALLVDLNSEELQQRLRDYQGEVPWATGANNHMGSRFTVNREKMRTVLQFLKEQNMFFVDSLTTADSVAIAEAEQLQIANSERDLFLDNVQNEETIRQQIRKLIRLAKEHGSAIGICHPHVETFAALRKEAPTFAKFGVKMVQVSVLTHQP